MTSTSSLFKNLRLLKPGRKYEMKSSASTGSSTKFLVHVKIGDRLVSNCELSRDEFSPYEYSPFVLEGEGDFSMSTLERMSAFLIQSIEGLFVLNKSTFNLYIDNKTVTLNPMSPTTLKTVMIEVGENVGGIKFEGRPTIGVSESKLMQGVNFYLDLFNGSSFVRVNAH